LCPKGKTLQTASPKLFPHAKDGNKFEPARDRFEILTICNMSHENCETTTSISTSNGEVLEEIAEDNESIGEDLIDTCGPERLRKGEAVLQGRTSRILLVLEQCFDSFNHQVISECRFTVI
jgi:hypothetical protein